jgi:hypothetical protein
MRVLLVLLFLLVSKLAIVSIQFTVASGERPAGKDIFNPCNEFGVGALYA